ncbi:hypothetical protein [Streptomyces sp. NPDC056670]|uniref:hypothetical protein n=1 Tax=Streptomyces sp. NPDC056670 TaxID=3345904 RepID=UPI0036BFA61E
MSSIDRLKPTDTWKCPLCKREMTMFTEGARAGGLRDHKAGDAGTAAPGSWCDGKDFSPFRPAFPQYVRLFGLEAAIADVRHTSSKPDWTPEPLHPGELQEFVWAAWPQADRFDIAPLTGVRGVTFTLGTKHWRFAAPDGYLSKKFTSRGDATDALYGYLHEQREAASVSIELEK